MPIVQIEILPGRSLDQKREMVKKVTNALTDSLKCDPEAVRIIIREMRTEDYAFNGTLYCDREK